MGKATGYRRLDFRTRVALTRLMSGSVSPSVPLRRDSSPIILSASGSGMTWRKSLLEFLRRRDVETIVMPFLTLSA